MSTKVRFLVENWGGVSPRITTSAFKDELDMGSDMLDERMLKSERFSGMDLPYVIKDSNAPFFTRIV